LHCMVGGVMQGTPCCAAACSMCVGFRGRRGEWQVLPGCLVCWDTRLPCLQYCDAPCSRWVVAHTGTRAEVGLQ
jgi:hypothetical protein